MGNAAVALNGEAGKKVKAKASKVSYEEGRC
jgi:hypothetical protein